jgi:malate dehydrogenase (oxaloacetate-decarboxylating)
MRGETYLKFVDKFVGLIRKHQPNALLHFEDFGVDNAQKLLDTYRDEHPVFNDDVQGTGAVTVSLCGQGYQICNTEPRKVLSSPPYKRP